MIGWNKRAPKIVALLDEFAAPGWHLQVAGPDEVLLGDYEHLTTGTTYCDPTNRAQLGGARCRELPAFDRVVGRRSR